MQTALEVMNMIRKSCVSDKNHLDRIDAAFQGYLNHIPKPVTKYTRSLDAIYRATPINYRPCFLKSDFDGQKVFWIVEYFDYTEGADFFQTQSIPLPSEALARLHAVIQCIERERGLKSGREERAL